MTLVIDAFKEEVLKLTTEQEFQLHKIKVGAVQMTKADLEANLIELARLWFQQQNALTYLMKEEIKNDISGIETRSS